MTDVNTACIRFMRTAVRLRIASHPFVNTPPELHTQKNAAQIWFSINLQHYPAELETQRLSFHSPLGALFSAVRIQHPAHAASGLSFETGLATQHALFTYLAVDDRFGRSVAKTMPN